MAGTLRSLKEIAADADRLLLDLQLHYQDASDQDLSALIRAGNYLGLGAVTLQERAHAQAGRPASIPHVRNRLQQEIALAMDQPELLGGVILSDKAAGPEASA